MVNDKYGENGVIIFEELMQFGILLAFQVFERVRNKLKRERKRKINESDMNKIKLAFIKGICVCCCCGIFRDKGISNIPCIIIESK